VLVDIPLERLGARRRSVVENVGNSLFGSYAPLTSDEMRKSTSWAVHLVYIVSQPTHDI
jgi:hypothetical protein